MRTALVVVTLLIAVFVLWLQLLLCVTAWSLAENVSEINHKIETTKPLKSGAKKRGKI